MLFIFLKIPTIISQKQELKTGKLNTITTILAIYFLFLGFPVTENNKNLKNRFHQLPI